MKLIELTSLTSSEIKLLSEDFSTIVKVHIEKPIEKFSDQLQGEIAPKLRSWAMEMYTRITKGSQTDKEAKTFSEKTLQKIINNPKQAAKQLILHVLSKSFGAPLVNKSEVSTSKPKVDDEKIDAVLGMISL